MCLPIQLLKGVDLPPAELTELDNIIEGRKLLDGPPGGRGRGGGGMNDHGMGRTSHHVMPVGGGLVGSTPLGRMLAAGLSGPPTPGYGGMGMGGYGAGNAGMVAATGAYGLGYNAMGGGAQAYPPNMGYGGQGQQHYGAQSGGYGRQQNSGAQPYSGAQGQQHYGGGGGGGYGGGGYGGGAAQNTYGGSGGYGPPGGSSLLHQLGNSFGNGKAKHLVQPPSFCSYLSLGINVPIGLE